MEDAQVLIVKELKHETEKAWLAILDDGREIWFPKSQCSKTENNKLLVPKWLLKAKDIGGGWDN